MSQGKVFESGLEKIAFDILENLFPFTEISMHLSLLPGTPDFCLDIEGMPIAIFIDGGFWHDRSRKMTKAGLRQLSKGEKDRALFWLTKAETNRARDRQSARLLRAMGYIVIRLHERGLRGRDPFEYVSKIFAFSILKKIPQKKRNQTELADTKKKI